MVPERVFTYNFRGNFGNLTAGLTAAGRNVTELGTKMTALDKNGAQMRAGLTQVGRAAGSVGLVAAAGLGAAVATAARFDKAMSSVQAATHETAGNMDRLRQAAIDAGASTVYSASEAAGAIEELAKAGVSTTDILNGGLNGALNLAAAGSLEVADAAEIAASALVQFRLSGDQTEHVADLLAAGAGKAQGSVQDLGYALKYAGVPAASLGISIEETTGTLAEFASAGIVGEQAGTTLRSLLLSMAAPTEKASNLMSKYGIELYDAQGKFVGMQDAAQQLHDRLGGLSEAQRNAALNTIFGTNAIQGAIQLYQGGGQAVADWTSKVDDQGYAAETAGLKLDNLSGDIEQFKGALETALIGAGDGSQGPLRSLVKGATEAVNAFNGLPKQAQSTTTALLGITAVTGGGLWFGSKVVQGVANTREALSDLGLTANRTQGSLGRMARSTGGIVALAGAVGILGNALAGATGAKVDVNDLSRDLEALANGADSDLVGRIADDFDRLGYFANRATEPLYEATTLFGVFGNTPNDNAKQNIEEVDQALASLVESGRADQAADAFQKIAAAITGMPEWSSFDPSAISGFESYSTALRNSAVETNGLADAQLRGVKPTQQLTAAQQDQADALKESRDSARDQARAFVGLGDSLNDSKVSLGDWIAQMREQANALRDFRQNAEQAANKGLRQGLIKALQEAGPEGAMRMKQLAGATKQQIAAANSAWASGQREVRKYTDAIGGVPRSVSTNVNINTASALERLNAIRQAIYGINAMKVGVGVLAANRGDGPKRATGGPIVGPGTKTSDDVPIMASNGEFVMSAAAVDHYGLDAMFAMNARRLASGGDVNGKKPKPAASVFSFGDAFGPMPHSIGAAVAALVDLRKQVDKLKDGIKDAERAVKKETEERDKAVESAAAAQAEVDRLTGLYDNLASTIKSGLTSDVFATVEGNGKSPWAAGATADHKPTPDEVIAGMSKDSANALAMLDAEAALKGKGLTGGALEAILAKGLETSQLFAALTPEKLLEYSASFGFREALTSAAGAAGGRAVYGEDMDRAGAISAAAQAEAGRQTAELNAANRSLKSLEKELTRLTNRVDDVRGHLKDMRSEAKKRHDEAQEKRDEQPEKVAAGVNSAATSGAKRGAHR